MPVMRKVAIVPFLAALTIAAVSTVACAADAAPAKPTLKFRPDGTFKVVMFSDVQDKLPMNDKTIDAMNRILDAERPDYVMLAGDNITTGVTTADEFKTYVQTMVAPMETRKIAWSHIYGNHDEDHTPKTGVTRLLQQPIYEAYPYCISQRGPVDVAGVGNYLLPVKASKSDDTVFSIWALDNGNYLHTDNAWYAGDLKKDAILPKMLAGGYDYNFLKFSQVNWYVDSSVALEKQAGRKVPSLMFMHMPLPEHRLISMNPAETGMVGEKNEDECNPAINSGLFAAILERGDVKGVFAGHDHVNDYVGTYCGIKLGYDANIGYATYGLDGDQRDRMRGARVFRINERNPGAIETWMRYASETK